MNTIHIFDQSKLYRDIAPENASIPRYFTNSVYYEAASLLGLTIEAHVVGYAARNISQTLGLSYSTYKSMKRVSNGISVVWQGFGVYAALASSTFSRYRPYLLNTYKVPHIGTSTYKTRINDCFLGRAISAAAGVVVISKSQRRALARYNPNVLWLPFTADSDWWTPAFPNYEFLKSKGIAFRDYVLIMGDIYRDEETTLRAVSSMGYPTLRVTRSPRTAEAARKAFQTIGIRNGCVLVNVPYETLREIYRGARIVLVPARNDVYPAGMTSMTEAMSCGRPVIIPSGQTTDGYASNGHDVYALDGWNEASIQRHVEMAYASDICEIVGRNARSSVEERLNFYASGRILADFISSLGLVG